jgi:signal transduction histidine kinase
MRDWLRGKPGGLLAFAGVAALVAGGLGWATAAALRLEREQWDSRAEAVRAIRLRLALGRLDGQLAPLLAREDGRPFNHYSAIFPAALALQNTGFACAPGTVLEPSPLLHAELPPWALLHFQADGKAGWASPQVLPSALVARLKQAGMAGALANVTDKRKELLAEVARTLKPQDLLTAARERAHGAYQRETTLLAHRDNDVNILLERLTPNRQGKSAANSAEFNNTQRQAVNPQFPYGGGQLGQLGGMNYGQLGGNLGGGNFQGGLGGGFQGNTAAQPAPVQNAGGAQRAAAEPQQVQQQPAPAQQPQANELTNYTRLPRDQALGVFRDNGTGWLNPAKKEVVVRTEVNVELTPMAPVWLKPETGPERLALVRLVRVEDQEVCQGVLLDDKTLCTGLAELVTDLFSDARLVPAPAGEEAENALAALPLRLDPGPDEAADGGPGWTPLRVGLALAWAAALVALLTVGLGGWSLLDLSERRIRFVSAVTHELRTPLTTLRLYLDMLRDGMVREEARREEYIRTLHGETDRLHRLVGNVLDFSRLEKQRPRLVRAPAGVADLLEQARTAWQRHCEDAGKELLVENQTPEGAALCTDAGLVRQVLSNLLDNACKYSREAADRRLWLRALPAADGVLFEVEDRGPGVPAKERRSVFRAFRRGRGVDTTAGGVGLGLALARRWARLLGGRLALRAASPEGGACFQLYLPG